MKFGVPVKRLTTVTEISMTIQSKAVVSAQWEGGREDVLSACFFPPLRTARRLPQFHQQPSDYLPFQRRPFFEVCICASKVLSCARRVPGFNRTPWSLR